MCWTLPNILTLFRLFAAPALGLVFLLMARPYADWAALILFVGAALTDYIDGTLARRWNQVSKFGAMLDPIADKAMVVIALAVLLALLGVRAWLMVPAVVILFREVFVTGLREYLGGRAGTLKVTPLAKWKTAMQMVAISLLFALGLFDGHVSGGQTYRLGGEIADEFRLIWKDYGLLLCFWGGVVLLWLSAGLTLVTGADYFRKALPYLKEARYG
ncbi:MAG: CDP-diacylglycerol--glycerol-3-phosphate 3-phosphatidyltransferase [Rhodobacteraceae bacterium]|nr:CDP-diacylglycerol--glycerol-3-phosphate 3-phosphatidyltransferase [Paracoccaceae bacterium]